MLLSGFFSGMEIAFVSSNRMLAEMDRDGNAITKKLLSIFYGHPNGFVSTMLVGNNIVLVLYGILIARMLDNTVFSSFDDGMKVTADTIVSTLIILFVGEFLPKILFKNNANRLLAVLSLPAYVFYLLLWPLSRFSTFLSKCIMRMAGIRTSQKNDDGFSKVDLDYLVQTSIDNADNDEDIDEEVKIFQNALDFHDTKVRDCMVPRTEINAVDVDTCTKDELLQKFVESGNSKIVLYKGDIDHIVGYIHSSEMFRKRDNWADGMSVMPFVPETMAAQKLMHIFLQQKKTLGVVVDEFGGTSGIVALEDIVEEIFGDIEDEHDSEKYIAVKTGDNEYMLSARLEIDKVNDMFDIGLPESDDYMTVGGYILHEYQSFPKLNEIIKLGHFEFHIIKSTMTKIELVTLKVGV